MRLHNMLLLFSLAFLNTAVYAQTTPAPDTAADTDSKTFDKVEVEASYPGGEQGWRSFLEKNLNPNVPIDNGAPVGRYTVIAQFVVAKDGTVSDVKALTNHGFGMEREVVEMLTKSGKWNPARQNNKFVNAYRKQPVTFMVTQDGFDITTNVPFVLFTGTENEVFVRADKVKGDDLQLTISQGTVIPKGDGNFMIKVNKPGKAVITVYGKKNKEIARVSFEVREEKK